MYGLSEEDLQIQARAREFADELIPFEEEAERSGGELPADVHAAHAKRARELGLQATNMPRGPGRRRLHLAAAGARPGADGPGDQRAGLGRDHPAVLAARRGHPGPARALRPARDRGGAGGVLRDHRGGRGLRRRRDRGDRPPGRRRLPAQRRQVARDLVQHRRLRLLPGQAAQRRARDVPGRPAQPGRPGGPDAGLLAHDRPPPPDRRLRGRARPGGEPGRRRGRRDGLRLRVVPVRADDGGGPLPRGGRAAHRTR